jgi:hypothetical protein
MKPLEVKPQSKLVEEEVRIIDFEVGKEPLVVVQVEIIEIIVE